MLIPLLTHSLTHSVLSSGGGLLGNLPPPKGAVLRGAHHLLKPGGEMYFSDVYADRRVPQAMAEDEVLYGECLSGALY